MADTPSGETENQQQLENKATPPATPHLEEKKTEDGEVDKLRKEKEQAEMRANQLANQLKAKDDADAKHKAEELKRKEEFKTLYEQTQAELEDVKREREAESQRKAVDEARQKTLDDYPDEVKAIAEDTGLSLKDATDDSIAEFKGRLDKIQTRLGSQRVTPNNPGTPTPKMNYTREELREILMDPQKRDEYYRKNSPITASMMNPPA